MTLESLLNSRALAVVGLVCLVLATFTFVWGAVKLAWQRVVGRPVPRNRLTMTLDVIADVATNILGAVSRVVKFYTGRSLFWPTAAPIEPRGDATALPRPDVPAPIEPAAPLTTGIGARAADDER